ncbi:MAG: hypothetical protein J0M35_10645 [Candidatus Obscuribacter phosphatis]|uniref:DprA winged helix domain-containing protein n=1 Tax=Candidatus Obscuribacter phosphatis TaxID=1906157 RepID=A0A8J7P854_9BACT|nr:hypothetical protein [Candidatus Obscuribacter phosphatis]
MSEDKGCRTRMIDMFEPAYLETRQLLLNEFIVKFPSDESCWSSLVHEFAACDKLRCRWCGADKVEVQQDSRTLSCNDCKKKSSMTAGTFFHGIKKVRAWFFAIWIVENEFYVSSKWFAQAIGISQSSALHILKSTLYLIEENSGIFESVGFGLREFRLFFRKRSFLTPAMVKPSCELQEGADESSNHDNYNNSADSSWVDVTASEVDSVRDAVISALKEGSRSLDEIRNTIKCSSSDVLAAITDLELDGEISAIAGNRFQLCNKVKAGLTSLRDEVLRKESSDSKSIFDAIALFCRLSFGIARGVSRKYLSLYLGFANSLVAKDVFSSFKTMCIESSYIGSKRLRAYASSAVLPIRLSQPSLFDFIDEVSHAF